jgi:predicted alpha/beta hydrolase
MMGVISHKIHFPDGTSNVCTVFTSQKQDAPVVVIFPALGVRAQFYQHYAKTLSTLHIHAATIDHRGHGNSSVRPSRQCNFGYREQIEIEYVHIVHHIKTLFPQSKIVVMGHSIGGQMGSMFASRYPRLVDGLILNASCSVYYKGWGPIKGRGVLWFAMFSKWIAHRLGYYPGHKIGFGHIEARGIIDDWHHTAISGRFAAHGSDYDYEQAMRQSTVPILALTYEGDASAPPLALQFLTTKFQSAALSVHHLRHPQGKRYNHYSWAREPDISLKIILDWLSKL